MAQRSQLGLITDLKLPVFFFSLLEGKGMNYFSQRSKLLASLTKWKALNLTERKNLKMKENQNQTKPKHQLIVWRILEEEELLFLCEVVILGHPSFS